MKLITPFCFLGLLLTAPAGQAADCPALRQEATYKEDLAGSRYLLTGQQGWIFQSEKDLLTDFRFQHDIEAELLTLSRYFKHQGTDLVIVLPPPRGIMAGELTPRHDKLASGYDSEVARTHYRNMIEDLNKKGIHAVGDADSAAGPDYYYKTDPHWTPVGARSMARQVAQAVKALPSFAAIPKMQFVTADLREETSGGYFLSVMQGICGDGSSADLAHETVMITQTAPLNMGQDALLGDFPFPLIALVGTSNSVNSSNFGGSIKESLGADIYNAAVIGGGVDHAMLSYLGSETYKKNPPKILIWELPSVYDLNTVEAKIRLRQMQPSIFRACTQPLIAVENVKVTPGKDIFGGRASKEADYIGLKFSQPVVEPFTLTIIYENTSREEVLFLAGPGLPQEGSLMGGGVPDDLSYFYAPAQDAKIQSVTIGGYLGAAESATLCALPKVVTLQH